MTLAECLNFIRTMYDAAANGLTLDDVADQLCLDRKSVQNNRATLIRRGVTMPKVQGRHADPIRQKTMTPAEWEIARNLAERLAQTAANEAEARKLERYRRPA